MNIISEKVIASIKLGKPAFFRNEFQKFVCWDDLERILNLRPFITTSRFKITEDTDYITWDRQAFITDLNSVPSSILDKQIIKNHVCLIHDLSRINETTNKICSELESHFPSSAADAHLYFSLGERLTEGFGIHKDEMDVLIVQMEGSSEVKVWDSSKTVLNKVLTPGDSVFIPAETNHSVQSLSKRLSVSFPIVNKSLYPPQDRHWIKLEI